MLLLICILSYLGIFICGIYCLKKIVFKVNLFPSKILPLAIVCALLSMLMFGNTARLIQFSTFNSGNNANFSYSHFYIYRSFVISIILMGLTYLFDMLIGKSHKQIRDRIKSRKKHARY